MADLVPKTAYSRQAGESETDYAHFQRYLELGSQRTVTRTAVRQGAPRDLITKLAKQNDWELRAREYDKDLVDVVREFHVDEKESLAIQGQLGEHLLRLGVSAMAAKRPEMMSVKQAKEVLQLAAELLHRSSGAADIKVSMESKAAVEDLVGKMFGSKDAAS